METYKFEVVVTGDQMFAERVRDHIRYQTTVPEGDGQHWSVGEIMKFDQVYMGAQLWSQPACADEEDGA